MASFLLLNSLLLLPGYLAYLASSQFFPWVAPSESGGLDRSLLHLIRRPDQDLFRLHVDLVLLLTVAAFASGIRSQRLASAGRIAFGVVFVYSVYEAVVGRLFHRQPNLLDDLAFFPGAIYLVFDLITWGRALLLGLGLVMIGLLFRAMFHLVRRLIDSPREGRIPVLRPILVGFWLIYLPLGAIFGFSDFSLTFRSTLSRAAANGIRSAESVRTLSRLRSEPVDSTYFAYRDLRLETYPDLNLFMIESYGSCLVANADFRDPYRVLLDSLEAELSASGWHMRSTHSLAPVYGGISWLSIATVLTGLEISSHPLHALFVQRASEVPHLVDLLRRWSYRTITLQPPNRKKPGLPLVNPFDFDIPVFGEDLAYTGTPYGLWAVPDQYSLGFTHEHHVATSEQPVFLFFETASTHVPWESIPPLVPDWRTLGEQISRGPAVSEGLGRRLHRSLRNRLGARPDQAESRYFASIRYNLEVLTRHLSDKQSRSPSLVVILGDHQPPIVADRSYGTPLHILSRDSLLLEPLQAFGFVEGLYADYSETAAIRHASLYSLIIHLLATRYGVGSDAGLFEVKPAGVPASILARER